MTKIQLKRLITSRDYLLKNVSSSQFNMRIYRDFYKRTNYECDSVGCAIGHLTILDEKFKTDKDYFRYGKCINFTKWSENYFKLKFSHYVFLFSSGWGQLFPLYDGEKQLVHCIERFDYLIKNKIVPEGFVKNLRLSKFNFESFPLGFSKNKTSISTDEMLKEFNKSIVTQVESNTNAHSNKILVSSSSS